MDINSASNNTNSSNTTLKNNSAFSSDFQTFLKMLTVQMQNQDPLDPSDPSDYAVQLATFAGVEQQAKTNSILSDLQTKFDTSGLVKLADWVGKDIRAKTSGYFDGEPIDVTFSIPTTADKSDMIVKDDDGKEVARFSLKLNDDSFEWDGHDNNGNQMAEGQYSFYVESSSKDEVIETEQTEVYSSVVEVQSSNGKNVLILNGGLTVEADSVTAIRNQT